MRARYLPLAALAFLARHWAGVVFVVLALLVVLVFAPRHMDLAVIVAAIVGAAVAVAALVGE